MSKSLNNQKEIVVAMSGGVDSSVAALLLLRGGYEVIGATMDTGYGRSSEQAQNICRQLGIEHHVIDVREQFEQQVVGRFIADYLHGETPNPCIECNASLKFPMLFPLMQQLDAVFFATGHYIRISEEGGRQLLYCADDKAKDQSYFLYKLPQEILSACVFPLGGYTKQQVRALAAENGLLNAEQKDSFDICFISDGDYRRLIHERYPQAFVPGDIVDDKGEVIGQHLGLCNYTVGQRHGINVALGYPAHVLSLDVERNRLVMGKKELLYSREAYCKDACFAPFDSLTTPFKVQVKVRYRAKAQPATIHPTPERLIKIVFDQPEWGITPGQSAVFYSGSLLVGGGVIVKQ